MVEYLRALSFKQPWLEMILRGEKRMETRNWKRDIDPNEPILFHASREFDATGSDITRFYKQKSECRMGAIVGVGYIYNIVEFENYEKFRHYRPEHLLDKWFWPVKYGWELRHVSRLETPIPKRGYLGFWKVHREQLSEEILNRTYL